MFYSYYSRSMNKRRIKVMSRCMENLKDNNQKQYKYDYLYNDGVWNALFRNLKVYG